MDRWGDLVGQRFHRLTVIRRNGSDRHQRRTWLCRCDCGIEVTVYTGALRSGNTTQCIACANKAIGRTKTKHGLSGTPIYAVWSTMKSKCLRPTAFDYQYYGGRGIGVCDEWKGFEAFYAWAIDAGYNESLTLGRIDNDGDYCPGNCRWETRTEQTRNRRVTCVLKYGKQVKPLAEWAEILGVGYKGLYSKARRKNALMRLSAHGNM